VCWKAGSEARGVVEGWFQIAFEKTADALAKCCVWCQTPLVAQPAEPTHARSYVLDLVAIDTP